MPASDPDPRPILSPRMRELLHRIERAGRPPWHVLGVEEARRAYEAVAEILDLPRVPLPVVEDFHLAARDGHALAARRYALDDSPGRPCLLYLHGGGFVIGSLETHDSLCRQLARRSGWQVVSLAYRLAPEHRFPTAVHDAFDALCALAAAAPPGCALAVAGDSAGGTLAAACAVLARDAGLSLSLQLLVTPGTTPHADTDSHRRFARGFLLDAETIAWFFAHYVGPDEPRRRREDWRFAPLHAEVEGVAPAALLLAEADPLVDEGLAYGDHLRRAGVAVELELVRGVTHDFMKMGRWLPEAAAALDFCASALRRAQAP